MDQDVRRQKNASEAEAAFKEGQGKSVKHGRDCSRLGRELIRREKGNQKLGQGQQQKKQKGNRRSTLKKDKKITCELYGLSYFYKQGLSKHKKEPFHKAMEQQQEKIEEQ